MLPIMACAGTSILIYGNAMNNMVLLCALLWPLLILVLTGSFVRYGPNRIVMNTSESLEGSYVFLAVVRVPPNY